MVVKATKKAGLQCGDGGAQRYKLEVGRVVRLKGRKGAERTECGARAGQGHTSPRDLA